MHRVLYKLQHSMPGPGQPVVHRPRRHVTSHSGSSTCSVESVVRSRAAPHSRSEWGHRPQVHLLGAAIGHR